MSVCFICSLQIQVGTGRLGACVHVCVCVCVCVLAYMSRRGMLQQNTLQHASYVPGSVRLMVGMRVRKSTYSSVLVQNGVSVVYRRLMADL